MKFCGKVALLLAAVGTAKAHDVSARHGAGEEQARAHSRVHTQDREYVEMNEERTTHHKGRDKNLRTNHHHTEPRCADVAGWQDSGGYTCTGLNSFAADPSMCASYGNDKGTNNLSANEACCVCKSKAPPPAATLAPGAGGDRVKGWVDGHNTRRQKYAQQWGYQYTAVGWNEELATQAKKWADFLLAKDCVGVNHIADQCLDLGVGENIYADWSSDPVTADINKVMTGWTEEEIAGDPSKAGHASQVLWKESIAIGCGEATGSCPNGNTPYAAITVCRYYARGNFNCAGHCIDTVKQKKTTSPSVTLPTANAVHQCAASHVSGYS